MSTDLTLKQGEQKRLTFTVTDVNGGAVDLTGTTLSFAMKRSKLDDDVVVAKTNDDFTRTFELLGVVSVLLTQTDTDQEPGNYYGELKITFADVDDTIDKSADISISIVRAIS